MLKFENYANYANYVKKITISVESWFFESYGYGDFLNIICVICISVESWFFESFRIVYAVLSLNDFESPSNFLS